MRSEPANGAMRLLPLGVLGVFLAIWSAFSAWGGYPDSVFPSPAAVWRGFGEEIASGRLLDDLTASLFRVSLGFLIAVALSVPVGLWLGHGLAARAALLPGVNFFRSLSPLAWIPFAVLWFGIGDRSVVFLIVLATFFPMALAICAAVASIPSVYFQVGRDYGYHGIQLLTRVTLPAIMPEFITGLRLTAGVAWMVVVAAEMLAGKEGLGFAIWDARNGLRPDLIVATMIVIGIIGVVLDRLLVQLTRLPNVRWGYER